MYRDDDPRLHSLYEALLEMAAGNFTMRIARSGADDATEELIVLTNMVVEELEAALKDSVIRSRLESVLVTGHCFLLDLTYHILSYSRVTARQLGYENDELVGMAFVELLDENSIKKWLEAKACVSGPDCRQVTTELVFRAKNQLLLPCLCLVVGVEHSRQIVVCSVAAQAKPEQAVLLHTGEAVPREKAYDAKLIQSVYDYIMANLDTPLPTIEKLSRHFGTNEFRLKDGFKHFFSTSIYQFYNEQRLKRAHLLIEQTQLQLKEIAFLSGFEDYPNFSKSFRKRFGYPPSSIVRKPPIA
jgi:AraC-like DNA-binding protein